MYVTVTTTYPHVFPGDLPNDKIIMLEDANDDGVADKSTVFADGLNIPTGLEWGDGGVYVGQNTELVFLQDTDGDNVGSDPIPLGPWQYQLANVAPSLASEIVNAKRKRGIWAFAHR